MSIFFHSKNDILLKFLTIKTSQKHTHNINWPASDTYSEGINPEDGAICSKIYAGLSTIQNCD
jgi:hypothetical protein